MVKKDVFFIVVILMSVIFYIFGEYSACKNILGTYDLDYGTCRLKK